MSARLSAYIAKRVFWLVAYAIAFLAMRFVSDHFSEDVPGVALAADPLAAAQIARLPLFNPRATS